MKFRRDINEFHILHSSCQCVSDTINIIVYDRHVRVKGTSSSFLSP